MKTKTLFHIFLGVIILCIGIFIFIVGSRGVTQTENIEAKIDVSRWKKFSSTELGIRFEYPDGIHLDPAYTDGFVFVECDECPGLINIQTATTTEKTIELAVYSSEFSAEKIVGSTELGDKKALIADSEFGSILFALNKNRLYRISARAIDVPRFLESVEFF